MVIIILRLHVESKSVDGLPKRFVRQVIFENWSLWLKNLFNRNLHGLPCAFSVHDNYPKQFQFSLKYCMMCEINLASESMLY